MDSMIERCYGEGVIAAQSALTGSRDERLLDELKAYFDIWVSGLQSEPADEMVAAWLIGFSKTLAAHFNLVAITSRDRPTFN